MSLKTVAAAALALVIAAPAYADHHKSYEKKADIVDTAVAAGSFNTLVAAVKAADLVETLKGDGPFTVFAPTDAAFDALPDGTVETLLKPENKSQLQGVLTYHVVAGKVMAADLAGKTLTVETVNGQTIAVDGTNGVTVNGAKVVKADIKTSNGVIHVVDAVLIPNGE
ncbi:MAG: fasciclin domain-containing protein [Pseudomonadota bacterium]